MAVPKKRRSYTKKKMRRSHQALGKTNLSACSQCAEPIPSHRICPNCGYYKGQPTLAVQE